MTRWGRPATFALAALAFVAILFLFVFPTRSYLAQRHQVANSRHDVNVLKQQNDELAQEAARLKSKSEIERLAREQYHYVYPGEQPYTVIPAPANGSTTTTTAP